jgi:UDP-3-O-[3-hydroxymyristoyl] glucosamine N-acyltransferase
MTLTLGDVARLVGGEILGPDDADGIEITGLAPIERAGPGQLSFVAAAPYVRFLSTTRAAAVMVTPAVARDRAGQLAERERRSALVQVEDPYRAFIRLAGAFDPRDDCLPPGIHPSAVVPPSAIVHPTARLGPYVVLGERVRIGPNCRLHPHVVLGNAVTLGADCLLYPQVTIREGCTLGNRVIVQPGAVIGADGFGYLPTSEGRREKVPQVGVVRIEDDVEIGANTTVDRATIDATVIRRGAKIDNLVQIAHNVEVGEDSCLAAQVGIAGSCRVGPRNLLAGQVGFAPQAETCADVALLGQSGVRKTITEPGVYFGSPAQPRGEGLRAEVASHRLSDALRRLRQLERRLAALEGAAPAK